MGFSATRCVKQDITATEETELEPTRSEFFSDQVLFFFGCYGAGGR